MVVVVGFIVVDPAILRRNDVKKRINDWKYSRRSSHIYIYIYMTACKTKSHMGGHHVSDPIFYTKLLCLVTVIWVLTDMLSALALYKPIYTGKKMAKKYEKTFKSMIIFSLNTYFSKRTLIFFFWLGLHLRKPIRAPDYQNAYKPLFET